MGIPGIAIQPVGDGNFESAVRFLIEWVSDSEPEARRYLAEHAEPDGASLIAAGGSDVIGYAAIVWESDYAGFRSRGIPLVHQIAVAAPFRRRGVATPPMDAAGQLARDRGIAAPGHHGRPVRRLWPGAAAVWPARLYPRRPGACQGQRPLRKGTRVSVDHGLIIWLTKDLAS
jgi:GNAT superfamily N-acetyltransferase